MVLKIAIFQKNDRNLIGKIMHCAWRHQFFAATAKRTEGLPSKNTAWTVKSCNFFHQIVEKRGINVHLNT